MPWYIFSNAYKINFSQQYMKNKEIPKMEENEGCWALRPCKIFESICIKTWTGKEINSSTYASENVETNLLTIEIQYLPVFESY